MNVAMLSALFRCMTVELGPSIRYEPASVLGHVHHLYRRRLPLPLIVVQTVLHVDLRRGHAGLIDPTLTTLPARDALSMVDCVHHHRKQWLRARPREPVAWYTWACITDR
jgi:hypothetical protein